MLTRPPSRAQVITMNEYQKSRFAKTVVSSMFNTITNKKLAVLGFAFKKDTGDTRETPSATVCRLFRQENAKISIYDPKVSEKQIFLDLTEPGVVDDAATGASLPPSRTLPLLVPTVLTPLSRSPLQPRSR